MKKKKVIISIFLVLLLLTSAFVVVEATNGEGENAFETLKNLITGNTNRIEKLENQVDTLENEIDKLKKEIIELQKSKEETTDNKASNTNSSNKKTTNKSQSVTTTPNYQNQIDTLNQEVKTLKKNHVITKEDLIGTWIFGSEGKIIFKSDGTATMLSIYNDGTYGESTYKYSINNNWITLEGKSTTYSLYCTYINGKVNFTPGKQMVKESNDTTINDNILIKDIALVIRLQNQISELKEKGEVAKLEAITNENLPNADKEVIKKGYQEAINYYRQAIAKYSELESAEYKNYSDKKAQLETKIAEIQTKIDNLK